VPVEASLAAQRVLLAPKDPSREHSVEQRLDQSGTKESFPLLTLEFEAEGFFERGPKLVQ
jgi:hypothetical protein